MRKYELTAVFAGTISDTDVAAVIARVQKIITDAGAANVEAQELGKHRLSYEVNNNKFGHYASFLFEAEPTVAAELERKLRLGGDVVRFVIELHVPARHKRQPQIADNPLIKASREKEREERNERGDREDRGSAPVFAAGHTDKPETKPDDKPVDLEEIDKKLDQLLQGDLTPAV